MFRDLSVTLLLLRISKPMGSVYIEFRKARMQMLCISKRGTVKEDESKMMVTYMQGIKRILKDTDVGTAPGDAEELPASAFF